MSDYFATMPATEAMDHDLVAISTNPVTGEETWYYFSLQPADDSKGVLTPENDTEPTDTVVEHLEDRGYVVRA